MANLKDIIGSIMRDMVLAQHQANQLSQSLYESYKQTGRTSGFKLPAVSLGEIELDIPYCVKEGAEETEEEDINYMETNRYVKYIAKESAELLVKVLAETVQSSGINYEEAGFGFINQLKQNRSYIRQLAKRLFRLLTEDVDKLMTSEKRLDKDLIISVVLNAADSIILTDEELRDLFLIDPAQDLNGMLREGFQLAITKEIGQIIHESKQAEFRRVQRFASINVIIDAGELSQLPESTIQHLKIKVIPQTVEKPAEEEDI